MGRTQNARRSETHKLPLGFLHQEEAIQYGHDYGENTLHYMLVQIDGDTCNVSAMYPDGTLIRGPNQDKHQTWALTL